MNCPRKYLAISLFALLAGCAANNPTIQKIEGVGSITLTSEQEQVVEAGVKQMVENPATATFSAKTAIAIAGKPGIHVCGSVNDNGKELPYYLELREKDGKLDAERGQVGSDNAKKSKVIFMCRRNG